MALAGSAGIWTWGRLPPATRSLAIQCLVSLMVNMIAPQWKPNAWLYNLYMPLDFGLTLYAATAFLPQRISRRYLPGASALYLGIWLLSLLANGLRPALFNWTFLSGCLLITITYMAVLFYTTLYGPLTGQRRVFGLCFAILLYYACAIPLFGMLNYLIKYYLATAQWLYPHSLILSNIRYLLIGIYFLSYAGKYADNAAT